jgi:hypothetical protein
MADDAVMLIILTIKIAGWTMIPGRQYLFGKEWVNRKVNHAHRIFMAPLFNLS